MQLQNKSAEAVLQTLKYFDVQDHALTLLEIHKYLLRYEGEKLGLTEILHILENDLASEIQQSHGFYFLSGRQNLWQIRLQNNLYAVPRLKRIARYLKFTRYIPFVDAVAVTGSEALSNSKQGSDIDLFVLVQPNRIWLARIFLSAFFHIFGVRRHDNKVENRFCLNHYISSNKIIDTDKNIYTAIEYVSLIPYFGGDKIIQFQKNNEAWITGFLHQPQFFEYQTLKSAAIKKIIEKVFANGFGNFLESLAERPQKHRIDLREHITVAKDELSFHPGSKGQQVLKKFKDTLYTTP